MPLQDSSHPQGMSTGSVGLVCSLIFQQPYSLKPPGTSLATLPSHPICKLHHCPPTACPEVRDLLHFGMTYLCVLQHFTLAYSADCPGWAAVTALSSSQATRAIASKLVAHICIVHHGWHTVYFAYQLSSASGGHHLPVQQLVRLLARWLWSVWRGGSVHVSLTTMV